MIHYYIVVSQLANSAVFVYNRGQKVFQVYQAHKVKEAQKARKDHRVKLEMMEMLDLKVSLEFQVPLAHR